MLIDFIATISAGFGAAGLALLARHLSGWRLPKWIVPLVAGLGMIGYLIWNEYTWFGRNIASLPPGSIVTYTNERADFWRPWTYLRPVTTRFAALDRNPAVTLPEGMSDDMRFAHVYLMERWKPIYVVPALFDCEEARRVDSGLEKYGSAQDIPEDEWLPLDPDDRGLQAACEGG